MQIILCVPADKFLVFGKRNIAFEDARTHAGCGDIRFNRVLRKHQRSTTVTDREQLSFKVVVGAGEQFFLQRAVPHLLDK